MGTHSDKSEELPKKSWLAVHVFETRVNASQGDTVALRRNSLVMSLLSPPFFE